MGGRSPGVVSVGSVAWPDRQRAANSDVYLYDAESRLTRLTDTIGYAHLQSDYTYDSQANFVRRRITSSDQPGITDTKDVYVEGIYEETSYYCNAPGANNVRKYYAAFGRSVAERTGSSVIYLLADHLGSTRGTLDASGSLSGTVSYYPLGALLRSIARSRYYARS